MSWQGRNPNPSSSILMRFTHTKRSQQLRILLLHMSHKCWGRYTDYYGVGAPWWCVYIYIDYVWALRIELVMPTSFEVCPRQWKVTCILTNHMCMCMLMSFFLSTQSLHYAWYILYTCIRMCVSNQSATDRDLVRSYSEVLQPHVCIIGVKKSETTSFWLISAPLIAWFVCFWIHLNWWV